MKGFYGKIKNFFRKHVLRKKEEFVFGELVDEYRKLNTRQLIFVCEAILDKEEEELKKKNASKKSVE